INPLIIEKGNIVNTIHSFPTHQTFFSSSNKLELSDIPFITNKHKPVRSEALAYYREVAKRNELKINAYEEVTFAEKKGDIFFIKTIDKFGDEKKYKSNFLVVATGYHDQPNLLNVTGSSLQHVKHNLFNNLLLSNHDLIALFMIYSLIIIVLYFLNNHFIYLVILLDHFLSINKATYILLNFFRQLLLLINYNTVGFLYTT